MELKWKNVGFNYIPGKAALICNDINNDGRNEILLDFNNGRYFGVMEYLDNDYRFKWTSPLYQDDKINAIKVFDINKDSNLEIYVLHYSGIIDVFDAKSMELKSTLNTKISGSYDFEIADIDNDGSAEFIIGWGNYYSGLSVSVLNSSTLDTEWSLTNIFTSAPDIEIGDVDNDSRNEIVFSNGLVIDGVSHNADWNYVQGFGNKIELGDIDGDNVKEIIGLSDYYNINTFDAMNKSALWSVRSPEDLSTLYVTDTGKDGYADIIVGNNQWGQISCYDSFTKSLKWEVNNPTHGSTNIVLGDPDNDGHNEVIWSAGESTSGPDFLHIGDIEKEKLEWTSINMDGPFYVGVSDLNEDGFKEIIEASATTNNQYDAGKISVYNSSSHKMEWNSGDLDPYHWRFSSLKVANIDSSRQKEIIITAGNTLLIFDSESHKYTQTTVSGDNWYYSITAMELSDLDNDGNVEIILGDEYGYIHIMNSETLEQKGLSVRGNGSVEEIILDDFDSDGSKEILALDSWGYITIYDGLTYDIEWQNNLTTKVTAVDIADINGDGVKELLAGNENGQILSIDISTKAITDTLENIGESISSLKVENIDADSSPEIIAGAERLYVFNASDKSKKYESELLGGSTGFGNNLVITDAENDRHMDIFASNNSGVFHFRCSEVTTDINPPYITSTVPKMNTAQVTTSTSIKLIFSEDINEADLTSENIHLSGNDTIKVPFTFNYSPLTRTITILPESLLPANASIKVLLSGNITDKALIGLDGNKNGISEGSPADDYVLCFTTGSGRDTISPAFSEVSINKKELWPGFDIKIEAAVSDSSNVSSNIEFVECFIDSITTTGAGRQFIPKDGLYNSPEEEIELTIQTKNWKAGIHYLYFVARDIEGNTSVYTIPINILSRDKMDANWTMYGQNPQHTNFNKNDLIKLPLIIKWNKKLFNNPINPLAVADDMVFVSEKNNQTSSKVLSLNTETGDTIWTYNTGAYCYVKAPAYYKGRLYIPIIFNPYYGHVYILDASTGEYLSNYNPGFKVGPNVTIADDKLFVTHQHGNIHAINAIELGFLWRSSIYSPTYDWTPAYSEGKVYTCGGNSSYGIFSADSGNVIYSAGTSIMGNTPVINNNTIYTTSPVSAINLDNNNILWTKPGSMPAAANGNVYIINKDSMYVLDELSGVALWTFKANSEIIRPPVISNNNIFLTTSTQVVAVNNNTHLETWAYPESGEVVTANGRLYLGTTDGYVICFEGTPVSVKNENGLPSDFELMQNYPNPFNPKTTIKYALPFASHVKIEVFNLLGELVNKLVDSDKTAGYHEVRWNAAGESNGVYFYRITAGDYIKTVKMLLLK